jgi:hypothetical protein
MHDPLSVVFHIRSPIPAMHRPQPKRSRGFLVWVFRDRTWRGSPDGEERRVPLRRRAFLSTYRLRGFKREWPLPTILTVWHRDPEADGSDSSCRNAVRARRQEAIKRHRFIRAAVWDWWWKHYALFHVHHWSIQFNMAQELRRRLLTRCATCGGRHTRKRAVNFHVVVDREAERARKPRREQSFRERWLTGEVNLHHHDCASLASIRAMKAGLPSWLRMWGKDDWCMNHQREQEPYYGCYPWWREAILGEDPETAAARAAEHVQRSCHACPDCAAGLLPTGEQCPRCEGTGHERVETPIPAAVV